MSTIWLVVTLFITLANSFLIWWLYRHIHSLSSTLEKRFSEMNLERELTDIFSHEQIDGQDIHKLSFTLFKRVKQQYGIKAHSYSEMVDQLKARSDIEASLRDGLLDFFENIIHVSYREKSLGEHERQDIKKKLKLIIGMLPPS